MILSAAALLREYGASATNIDRVLAHNGAPRGSVYHHFPGGRRSSSTRRWHWRGTSSRA
ncbi:TetR family transcriptional regulator [Streptomyces avermitilis]|uniref:TetR family transcriptional regulator n=1 Tax=Streptomyces avermitilis TaxID=33903 RepID=UPI00381FC9C6